MDLLNERMLMYGKEASNRKQGEDWQTPNFPYNKGKSHTLSVFDDYVKEGLE